MFKINLIYGYVVCMTKRLIDLDDELLKVARLELGTTGVSDTVRTALQQASAKDSLGIYVGLTVCVR